MRLSPYNFIIKHRSGKYMKHMDALSRNPISMLITNLVLFLSHDEILMAQKSTSSIPEKVKKIGQTLIFKQHGVRKTFIPKELVPNLLIQANDKLGNPGFTKTFNMIKSIYWWPTIYQDVFDFCKICHFCQLAKSVLHKLFGPLQPLETPSFPLEIVSMDTIDIGSVASNTQKKYVLVIIDHFSRYV